MPSSAREKTAGLQVDAVGAVDGARRGAGHEDRRGGIGEDLDGPRAATVFFFFNDTAPAEFYTLSLHAALPICRVVAEVAVGEGARRGDDHRVAARRDAA